MDTRASYLGLRTVRRLPIRTQDLSKFGTTTRTYLFIHLPSLPSHYLVLVLADEGFRFALISVKEGSDSIQTWLCLEEIGWLDKVPRGGWNQITEGGTGGVFGSVSTGYADCLGTDGKDRLDVSIDDLRDLHLYCVYVLRLSTPPVTDSARSYRHRIASFKIEQQLHLRRIPYKPIASALVLPSATRSVTPQRLSQTSPYLVVQSADLLQSPADVAYPNVAVQSSLQDQLIRVRPPPLFPPLLHLAEAIGTDDDVSKVQRPRPSASRPFLPPFFNPLRPQDFNRNLHVGRYRNLCPLFPLVRLPPHPSLFSLSFTDTRRCTEHTRS